MKLRTWALSLAIALAAVPALAQQMAPRNDTPVTIRFANYNLTTPGPSREVTLQMLEAFGQAHPGIKVEQVALPAAEIMARLQADAVAGQIPDIAQVPFGDTDYVVANFGARALEDIVPAAELREHFAGFYPNGLELGRLNGKTYSLAYVFSTPVLYYNADLFRAAGLNPDAPPKTWDEVKTAAQAINKATGKAGLVTGVFFVGAYDWLVQSLVLSNGGRVLSTDRKTLTFAEPPGVGAVQMLRGIADTGAMPNLPFFATIETMASGNAGLYLQTSAIQGALVNGARGKYELRATTMPAFAGRPAVPTNSGSALFILTRDPAKQRAAWELMKSLSSDEGYTTITSKIGYLPLRPKAVESEQYLAGWIRQNPMVQPNLDQLARLAPWESMPGPNYVQIRTIMMTAIEDATFGKADVAAVLADAQRRAQALMPR